MEQQAIVYIVSNGQLQFFDSRDLDFPGLTTVSLNCAASLFDTRYSKFGTYAESCILADIIRPNMSGAELQKNLPNHGFELPIVFFVPSDELVICIEAMRQGAISVVEKNCSETFLPLSVCDALQPHTHRSKPRADEKRYRRQLNTLTPSERQVYALSADTQTRYSGQTITNKLSINEQAVELYTISIAIKMETHSLPALMTVAQASSKSPRNRRVVNLFDNPKLNLCVTS